jgi:CheY-like chemotaxis protein
MSSVEGSAPRKPRILVVDDDHETRLLLSAYLAQRGYHVESVADGNMALTMVQARQPDLVLLDAHLPRLDGYSACRAIKDAPATARLPVIIVTAFGGADGRARCEAAGADELVEKPFHFDDLMRVIERFLPLS